MSRRGLVSLTTRRSVRRKGGELSTAATRRLEERHAWYATLGARERSWVALVAQAGITNFIDWLNGTEDADLAGGQAFTAAGLRVLTHAFLLPPCRLSGTPPGGCTPPARR